MTQPETGKPLRIVIAGLGTVGGGVIDLLRTHGDLIAQRAGRPIQIVAVSSKNRAKMRSADIGDLPWTDDPARFCKEQGADALVELIGGSEGAARTMVSDALGHGIPIVTANKALLAHHGHALAMLAEANHAPLLFEAAVAGGIPIIKTLREGLAGNTINAVYGILNGTCNYILTEMRETGRDFGDVLASAQALGYAEADPSFDVDGVDTAHKLSLLSALAFGHQPDLSAIETGGIRAITALDIKYAAELGYRIKLLGIARRTADGIVQSVEPCLVPVTSIMGAVDGVFNAVSLDSDFAGRSLSVGRGAGAHPTASAVIADLIDLARGNTAPVFGVPAQGLTVSRAPDLSALTSAYYLHIEAVDRPGVLADIAATVRDHDISVESVIQRGRDPGKPVSIVLVTHGTNRRQVAAALSALSGLNSLTRQTNLLRIENF